jgi:hypothetical protein
MPETDFTEVLAAAVEGDDLHLIYKIEGHPNEVDIFELSRVLEGLGEVLRESNRLAHPESDLTLRVQPFQQGSFIMDIAMHVQANQDQGNTIFALLMAQPDFLNQAKEALEYLGLIKKVGEVGASLLELLRRLRTGKPARIEEKGDHFEYKAEDGGVIPDSAPVHNLYNSGVVNNFIYNIAAPVERPDVVGVKTFLKNMEQVTGVQITKDDASAIRKYVEPPPETGNAEVLENTSVYMLNPKSGNYGETTGQWTFKIAGTSRMLKAKITDPTFLAKYTNGVIRFYAQDLLKARVYEKQVIEGSRVKVQNEIIEVLEYREAHPSERK